MFCHLYREKKEKGDESGRTRLVLKQVLCRARLGGGKKDEKLGENEKNEKINKGTWRRALRRGSPFRSERDSEAAIGRGDLSETWGVVEEL